MHWEKVQGLYHIARPQEANLSDLRKKPLLHGIGKIPYILKRTNSSNFG